MMRLPSRRTDHLVQLPIGTCKRLAIVALLVGSVLVGAWTTRTVSAAPLPVPRQAFVPSEATAVLDLDARETAALVRIKNVALDVRGTSGLPAVGATYVALDVDIVGAAKAGRVLLAPAVTGRATPSQSVAIPFNRGPARKVPVVVPIGTGGRITVATNAQLAMLRVSITGWIGPESAVKPGEEVVRGEPCRLLDTATDLGGARGAFAPGNRLAFPVTGVAQVPEAGSRSVIVALTAADAARAASIFASGGGNALTFSLPARSSRMALFALPAPKDAEVTLSLTGAAANIALDVIGYDTDGTGMQSGGPCEADAGAAASAVAAPVAEASTPAPQPTGAPATAATTRPVAATAAPTTAAPTTATTTTAPPTIPPTVITFPPNVVPGQTTTTVQAATTQATTTTTTPAESTTTVQGTTTTVQGTTTTTNAGPSGRATADRPDEVTGQQIHVVYMVASDGADQNLDGGTIQSSINSLQTWMNGQTSGRRFKMDTHSGGQLDVSFRRSTYTESFLSQKGIQQLYWLGVDLRAGGFIDTNKWYLIYYGGPSTTDCFQGPLPPTWGGRFGALLLNGTRPGGGGCSGYGTPGGLGYWEMGAAHVLLHMLGAVPACAPNRTGNGHVSQPNDVMFGDKPGWQWQNATLDVGHDDYWGHAKTGCPDVEKSILITPTASAAVGPPEGPDRPPNEGEGE